MASVYLQCTSHRASDQVLHGRHSIVELPAVEEQWREAYFAPVRRHCQRHPRHCEDRQTPAGSPSSTSQM
jgi:hypothetical protein